MRWWLISLSIGMIGCSESGRPCGGKFLILWPDAQGDYAPRVVPTPTLKNAKVLSGPAARVYAQASIGERGYRDQPAEPHVTNSGDVCVPTDAVSSAAVSAYAQFERLRDFDVSLGVADQVSWPRNVGVEMRMNGDFRDTHNNAHYIGDRDITNLVPTTWTGVPLAMNLGVVAHEHFHAHFQSQVLGGLRARAGAPNPGRLLDGTLGTWDPNFSRVRTINETVLRAWNEGLADFYATVYTGDPRFLRVSFQAPLAIMARALDAGYLYLGKSPGLEQKAEQMRFAATRRDGAESLTNYAYAQGTALARILYHVTRAQTKVTPAQALTKMMKGLSELPRDLAISMDQRELDFADVVPVLLGTLDVDDATCRQLKAVMHSNPQAYAKVASCLYVR